MASVVNVLVARAIFAPKSKLLALTIWPVVTSRIKATETVSLSVIDILGKVVYSNNQVNNETIIDVSNLQKGVYLVKVMGENVYSTEKLILN